MLSGWQGQHAFVTNRQDDVRDRDREKRTNQIQRQVGLEM